MVLHREKTRTMVLCAMFVVLIAAGAWIKIPVPVVPFTLQYLFTMLAGILLGGRRGALAVCAYLALGLAGLPGRKCHPRLQSISVGRKLGRKR